MRIGHGYDVHRFGEGDQVTLGGVFIYVTRISMYLHTWFRHSRSICQRQINLRGARFGGIDLHFSSFALGMVVKGLLFRNHFILLPDLPELNNLC